MTPAPIYGPAREEEQVPDDLRWGVLGCADIGLRAVVPALQAADNSVVTAIASRNLDKARQAAARLGISTAHGSYEALLEDASVDAVYIPLPNSLHVPWALKAVAAGKHVLCEKPLATRTADIDTLWRAADGAGMLVMEALMYQYHPQTRRVIEIVRSGALGAVELVSASFTYDLANDDDIRLAEGLGGGVLWDVGTYCVHVARQAFGTEPMVAAGMARFGPQGGVDEAFTGLLQFPTGMATFGCSLRAPRTQSYTITGSEASLRCPIPFSPGSDDRSLVIQRGRTRDTATEEIVTVTGADQYRLMAERFAEKLREARPIRNAHLADARANVAALDALLRSAKSGAFVNI